MAETCLWSVRMVCMNTHTTVCWCRHRFSGAWQLRGKTEEQLISDISTWWSELFTTRGNLRDPHVFTITCLKWWKGNWGSRVRRWCSPTPFNKCHLFSSKRGRKVTNGTGVINFWPDVIIMQLWNILHYKGPRVKLHHCEFYILNIIPCCPGSLLESGVLTRLKPGELVDKAVSHFPFMSYTPSHSNTDCITFDSHHKSVVRSSMFVSFISFLSFIVLTRQE